MNHTYISITCKVEGMKMAEKQIEIASKIIEISIKLNNIEKDPDYDNLKDCFESEIGVYKSQLKELFSEYQQINSSDDNITKHGLFSKPKANQQPKLTRSYSCPSLK